jgi:hypothetical protein
VTICFPFASQKTFPTLSELLSLFAYRSDTYCFWTMKHPYTKIPKQESAIFTNAPEAIVSVIATPRIKANSSNPGLMTLATCNDCRLGNGPDRD